MPAGKMLKWRVAFTRYILTLFLNFDRVREFPLGPDRLEALSDFGGLAAVNVGQASSLPPSVRKISRDTSSLPRNRVVIPGSAAVSAAN